MHHEIKGLRIEDGALFDVNEAVQNISNIVAQLPGQIQPIIAFEIIQDICVAVALACVPEEDRGDPAAWGESTPETFFAFIKEVWDHSPTLDAEAMAEHWSAFTAEHTASEEAMEMADSFPAEWSQSS